MFLNLLFAILSTSAVKALIGEGINYLLDKTPTDIDNKLAGVLVNAVITSNGNDYSGVSIVSPSSTVETVAEVAVDVATAVARAV